MSWMQSTLFPALPNDISMAMTQLVSDLEDFNDKFESNTTSLSHTFDNVNQAYKTQADIVSAVQKMDVQSMATANVRVLEALNKSTEKLERFNGYLDSIHGYTNTIQKFNEQFHEDENQLGLLRQIRDFFKEELHEVDQRKQAIAAAVSDVDLNLKNALQELTNSSNEQLKQLDVQFQKQAEQFQHQLEDQAAQYNELLNRQKQAFEHSYDQICQAIEEKLKSLPEGLTKLEDLTKIPDELHALTTEIQSSMKQMSASYAQATAQLTTTLNQAISRIASTEGGVPQGPAPLWKRIVKGCVIGLTIIAIFANAIFMILSYFK